MLLLALVTAATACGTQEPVATTRAAAPATEAVPTVTTVPPTTVAVTVDPGLPPAPWSVPPLPDEAAPSVLLEAWEAAANKGFCAALYPADANDLAADAVVRSADFGEDAWALAWDRPEGPGRDADGTYCDDCGRSAFGIAGTGGLSPTESVAVWPTRIEWNDGSAAGYGIEGMALPGSGAPHLSYMSVAGQGCTYDVWSFLGEDHLLQLIDELRFVEGMLAAVVGETEDAAVQALGAPPWLRAAVGSAAVPQPLLDEWTDEVLNPETCPLLSPVSLGVDNAEARRANSSGELLAAWDLPAGPGRYGTGDYCADCGRGAVGIGTVRRNIDVAMSFERYAITHTWDDGSVLRVVSEATEVFNVPPDRAEFTDPRTDEPAVAPYNAYLTIPGLGCSYQLWSFLGQEHVVDVVQSLRPVIGFGESVFTLGVCPAGAPSGDFDGDGTDEQFEPVPARDADTPAKVIVCRAGGAPPLEVGVSGPGEGLSLADVDGDGDVEILTAGTAAGALFFEIWTEGESGEPTTVFTVDGEVFVPIEGVTEGVGYRWGCRDDGTLVQVEGTVVSGALQWTRAAYRVEGLIAVPVGEGSGSTPVSSSELEDALFEDSVTELVGEALCETSS